MGEQFTVNGTSEIQLNNQLCESMSAMRIAGVILHESVHAYLHDIAQNGGYLGSLPVNDAQLWLDVLNNQFNGNHHDFIVEYVMELMSATLHALNGSRGERGSTWDLLSMDWLEITIAPTTR